MIFWLASCSSLPFNSDNQAPVENTSKSVASSDTNLWSGNTLAIWNKLQQIPLPKLESYPPSTNPNENGWIKLATASKKYSNNTPELIRQLIAWRAENPGHPGNTLFPDDLTLNSILNQSQPKSIALLLPLQGQVANAGQNVKEGFLGAYYQSQNKTASQTINFYDTQNQNMVALYQQAVAKGADMVIGPLTKEDVETLTRSGNFSVPTIALNYTDVSYGSLPNNLYQFGLSPLDEAQQVADKAHHAGLSRAIMIVERSAAGERVSKKIASRWEANGGSITETFYFNNNADFNQEIAKLLHVNPKEDRLKTRAGDSKADLQQQRRQDFDVIFLLSSPTPARAIVPLLKFYYADNIPIYSTSMIYSGSPSPQKDTDLNGVIFCDTPSVLKSQGSNRFSSVGHDAYTLSRELPRLTKLPNFPIYAETGALTMTPEHQIFRRLPWITMRNGHP